MAKSEIRRVLLRAEVRRHDDDRIREINSLPARVGETCVTHHAKQQIEERRMRLLDFVEQHNRKWLAAHHTRQILGSVECSDQARYRGVANKLVHIEPQQAALTEQVFRQRLGALCFAYASWTRNRNEAIGLTGSFSRALAIVTASARRHSRALSYDFATQSLDNFLMVELLSIIREANVQTAPVGKQPEPLRAQHRVFVLSGQSLQQHRGLTGKRYPTCNGASDRSP